MIKKIYLIMKKNSLCAAWDLNTGQLMNALNLAKNLLISYGTSKKCTFCMMLAL